MPEPADEMIPTRATLIHRLKNWKDQSSWQDFFDTYWKLIYNIALKGGLSEAEAQDVVQETIISVAKHMPSFQYDPAVGFFKTWLCNMARWRISDKIRKRGRDARRITNQCAIFIGVGDNITVCDQRPHDSAEHEPGGNVRRFHFRTP